MAEASGKSDRYHGYDRGWFRYSFDTEEFRDAAIHGGGAEIGVVNFLNRGYMKPHISYGIIYPDRRGESPAIGLHVHRDEPKNPLTAECAVCGSVWERPADDIGANTLADWSVEHACAKPFKPVHLPRGERLEPEG